MPTQATTKSLFEIRFTLVLNSVKCRRKCEPGSAPTRGDDMDDFVLLDFESQSAADLPRCGAAVYASHPTTQVSMLWYSFNGDEPILWDPRIRYQCPGRLKEKVVAHWDFIALNSMFEQMMWERHMVPQYHWPEIAIEQWYDTMASCA